jgi:hypothetical protein
MSLQIRRGTEAQRSLVIFDAGEVVYTTDTNKLYVGDGITTGGKNVLATSAGGGVTFNNTTQRFDFTTTGLNLTTSDVSEGTNFYYTRQRAQDDSAALFTAAGAPTSTGNITATSAPNTVSISGSTATMVVGQRFVITGTGGNGLTGSPTTYYVAQIASGNQVKLATSRLNALAGTPLVVVTANASYTGTTYAGGGESSNVVFTYDSVNHTMIANVTLDGTGISSVQADTNPTLGGNLVLNSRNITGTGNINITGSGTFTSATITSLTAPTTTIATKLNVDNIGSISASGVNISANLTTPLSITGIGTLAPTSGQVYLAINAAKGTLAAPTATAAGDILGGIVIQGYTGAVDPYKAASVIASGWDAGAVLSDAYPKSTLRMSAGGGGSTIRVATFDNQGVFTVPIFKTGSYTTTEMNAISSPLPGMIIFNTTANDFYGYNGSAWVAFVGP